MVSPQGKRILIFATDLILDGINTATISILLMDGTFKISPSQFAQLWVIRVRIGRSHIPVLYALLEDKHKTSSQTVLQWLHIRCPFLDPTLILSPHRLREGRALGLQDFHFNQLQLRQFRKISDYHSIEVLRIHLRCVYGLPFFSLTDLMAAWTELKAAIWSCCQTPAISTYITYFEKN